MWKCVALIAVALLVACGESEPVESDGFGPVLSCSEQPFRAELHVDANDPRGVWATNYDSGLDVAVKARPPGRFLVAPDRPSTLLDGDGNLVTFAGEISRTGCFDAVRQVVYFGREDLPDPNRPGG